MVFSVGFDSASFRQQTVVRNKTHTTRGIIGIGVKTDNVPEFNEIYTKALADIFKKFQVKQARPAYCAAELSAIFGAQSIDKEKEALEMFLKEIKPVVKQIHLFYTFLFKFKTVTIFGDDPNRYERIPVVSYKKGETDFYGLIEPAYPMLCAWKYGQEHKKDSLLLDNFQGRVCPAWTEFLETNSFKVYYNGDRCNGLISTADLLTRLVKIRMLDKRAHFLKNEMETLLPEVDNKLVTHFLGSIYLKKMVPHKRKRIDCIRFVKHKVNFIVRESPEDSKERGMIESTPVFNKLLVDAFREDGCVKFFDKDYDTRILEKQDKIVTFGERGEKIVKQLKKLGEEFETNI